MDPFEQNKVEVDSWAEAQEELFVGSWQSDLNRYRPSFAYRGLNKHYRQLPTSLIRLGRQPEQKDFDPTHGTDIEKHIFRNFIKYARDQSLSSQSEWHQLSVAQHYGLPTRILDWTYSPLVALHFATENLDHLDQDGVVWVVDIDEIQNRLPEEFKAAKGGSVFTIDELNKVAKSLDEFDGCFENTESAEQPIFFEPPSLDDRIVNQFALFSIYPDPEQYFDEWLESHPDLYKKVVISEEAKMEIRDKLDASNISERMLFPGLDGLADWLTRYYAPIKGNETTSPDH